MSISINSEALNNAAIRLNVIGNNIANVNTSGYKGASFSETLKAATGSSGDSAGVTQTFKQGAITSSTNPLNMAISGDSLFMLETADGITYSRNSQFSVSKDNSIVDSFGDKLMGYGLGENGLIDTTTVMPITLNTGKSTPYPTSSIKLAAGLISTTPAIPASIIVPPATTATAAQIAAALLVKPFNPLDATTYNNSTMVTTYDAIGAPHQVQTYFRRNPDQTTNPATTTWNMYTAIDGAVTGGTTPTATSLEFSTSTGKLKNLNSTISLLTNIPDTKSTTANAVITYKLDLAGTTQGMGLFSIVSSQDGKGAADMSGYKVNNDGTIQATYADGSSAIMAQVGLVKFNNLQGLNQLPNNQWSESVASGKPQIGMAGEAGFGSIQGSSIESSNVDLTVEMVLLIAAQRAFQSAAEVVKKQDETVQTINRISG